MAQGGKHPQFLEAWRIEAGLNQSDLARLAGINRRNLVRLEREHNPRTGALPMATPETLLALANALNTVLAQRTPSEKIGPADLVYQHPSKRRTILHYLLQRAERGLEPAEPVDPVAG